MNSVQDSTFDGCCHSWSNPFYWCLLDKISNKFWKIAILNCTFSQFERLRSGPFWLARLKPLANRHPPPAPSNRWWRLKGNEGHNFMFQHCHRGVEAVITQAPYFCFNNFVKDCSTFLKLSWIMKHETVSVVCTALSLISQMYQLLDLFIFACSSNVVFFYCPYTKIFTN